MMLYLTGAQSSLIKSGGNSPQLEVNNSLGGYISSTPVPNGAVNKFFDVLSNLTLSRKQTETVAIALINKLDEDASNVKIKLISDSENSLCSFLIGVTNVDKALMQAEYISNRYEQPIQVDFYNIDFSRASTELIISKAAQKDDTLTLYPFNVDVDFTTSDIDGNSLDVVKAFYNNNTYTAKIISSGVIKIEYKSNEALSSPIDCSLVTDGEGVFNFSGKITNLINNSKQISNKLSPGDTLAIWIQRKINDNVFRDDQKLIDDYVTNSLIETTEKMELIFEYDLSSNP